MMTKEISKQVEQLMENLINTVELAEEAPDFVASALQDLFDDYADERLEAAAAALETIEGGTVSVRLRGMMKNSIKRQMAEKIGQAFQSSLKMGK